MARQLRFDGFALIGRTYEEYRRMFNLNDLVGDESILDVASGVGSFCAEGNRQGYKITASDQVYSQGLDEIKEKSREDLDMVIKQMPDVSDLFVWNFYDDINSLNEYREKSRTMFLDDYERHNAKRYVPVTYPDTDFKTNQFDLSLVSHFLFLYERLLDYDFHKRTVLELLRITSGQIRIFPIVNLTGEKSSMIDVMMDDSDFKNLHMSIHDVDFEFMKGGNKMLVIEK